MIPDKIYTFQDDGDRYWYKPEEWETPPLTRVEYIRKDALLEWLKNEYETISWYYEKMKHVTGSIGDTSSSGKAEAYKKVIEKIESL